ncbi:hypothetical protein NQS96_13140 [Pseudoalteromonas shioyasakiensis]|uniref:hypothetical protein n=1 Tax=Pseudoalteromonas shioyasakiensis TaxID=1190813 RepID=UPI002118E66D|nr:hypothetical protein [Pseudoalteromonas shioyasakiensis]MCQ8882719.1 hypothetical protein [Pseudoalteromonas shioyasakiensis]
MGGIAEIVVCGFIVLIVYIAVKGSGEKDAKIRKLEENKARLLNIEFNKRFKEIHGISFSEAYESAENKKKWDEWGERVRTGQTHWQPDYYDYISDGLFNPDKSKHIDIILDLEEENY